MKSSVITLPLGLRRLCAKLVHERQRAAQWAETATLRKEFHARLNAGADVQTLTRELVAQIAAAAARHK